MQAWDRHKGLLPDRILKTEETSDHAQEASKEKLLLSLPQSDYMIEAQKARSNSGNTEF